MLLVWNFSQGVWQCSKIEVGKVHTYELDVNKDDHIILNQTDFTCYSSFGRKDIKIEDPEGIYDIKFEG